MNITNNKKCNIKINDEDYSIEEDLEETMQCLKKANKEIDRLNNIIKEVREYIEHENFKRNILVGISTKKYTRDILNNILEILDKGE